jgi:hypothetical protein
MLYDGKPFPLSYLYFAFRGARWYCLGRVRTAREKSRLG